MRLSFTPSTWLTILCLSLSPIAHARHSASFTENKGQVRDQFFNARPDIQYGMQAGDVSVFIGKGQLHYQWYRSLSVHAGNASANPRDEKIDVYRMDVELLGANTDAVAIADGRSNDYELYYQPYLPEQGVVAYGYKKIIYKNIYPNIDWVLYAKDGSLKYDFVVRPGGNAADIKMRYKGATTNLGNGGSITAATPFGTISEDSPYSYDRETGKTVPSSFILNNDVLSFSVPSHAGTLVIDPAINWITYYGGLQLSSEEWMKELEADAAGNVYVGGITKSAENIATTGAFQTTIAGNSDGFAAKFNALGVRQWGTYFGGTDYEGFGGIGLDPSGNVYAAGPTYSVGLATAGAHKTAPDDLFIVKLNGSGAREWSTYYDGTAVDVDAPVACDGSGNIYIAHSGGALLKMTSAGVFNWDNPMVGASQVGDLICDANDNIYWAGTANLDAYVRKTSSAGVHAWTVTYGGTANERGQGVAVDTAGNVYLSGMTQSFTDIATTGAHRTTRVPNLSMTTFDGFVVKINNSGAVQWGSYYGYYPSQWGFDVAVMPSGRLFHSGIQNHIAGDPYLIEIDPATSAVIDTTVFHVPFGFSYYMSLCPSASGSMFATSWTQGTVGIATPGAHQTTISGPSDPILISFKVDSTTGIRQTKKEVTDVQLFPNPNGGNFTVGGIAGYEQLEITDVTGRLVYQSPIEKGKTGMNLKLAGELANGQYLLRLQSAAKTEVLKLTISR